jgi:D-alanyl-D-alanine carboxypeptidase
VAPEEDPVQDVMNRSGSWTHDAFSRSGSLDKDRLRRIVADTARALLGPGAMAVIHTPLDELQVAYGVRTRGGSQPVQQGDHVRIGSITKTWTGTVILQQMQEGLLDLTTPLSRFMPGVPNGDDITMAHLLNMSSGLFNYTELLSFNRAIDQNPSRVWTFDELVQLALDEKPYFDPGEGFHYSNTNTLLLGRIAEMVERSKPLAQIFRDRLFGPLLLRDSAYPDPTTSSLPDPHPQGYMYGDNVLTMANPPALPPDMQAAARNGTLDPVDQTTASPSWTGAAGAGISTIDELMTWGEALTSGRLLRADAQHQRMSAHFVPTDPTDPHGVMYGLGIARFGPFYGHTGELPGFNVFVGNDPVKHITISTWTTLAPAVDGRDPAVVIARALIDEIYSIDLA